MLQVEALTRRYESIVALENVSLEVRGGEIVGLLGANGAGKSTLLRTAAGLQPPDRGRVLVCGLEVWEQPLEAKRAIGYVAEEPAFYEELSLDEHLTFIAGVRALEPGTARLRAHDLAARLGLHDRLDEPLRQLSHGMRKKASFLMGILHRPAVLLCDEALEGFDAAAALAAKQELRALASAGTAILFSSHVTETVERLCDRAVILERGRVARTLSRAEWGAPAPGPSALERVFLEVHPVAPSE